MTDVPLQVWCHDHFALVGAGRDRAATVLLIDAFAHHADIAPALAGHGDPPDPALLRALAAEHTPLCCFVAPSVVYEIIEETLEGGGGWRIDAMLARARARAKGDGDAGS